MNAALQKKFKPMLKFFSELSLSFEVKKAKKKKLKKT